VIPLALAGLFRDFAADFAQIDDRFDRLERKVDQIISLQLAKRPGNDPAARRTNYFLLR
jgi:hypothetical protein